MFTDRTDIAFTLWLHFGQRSSFFFSTLHMHEDVRFHKRNKLFVYHPAIGFFGKCFPIFYRPIHLPEHLWSFKPMKLRFPSSRPSHFFHSNIVFLSFPSFMAIEHNFQTLASLHTRHVAYPSPPFAQRKISVSAFFSTRVCSASLSNFTSVFVCLFIHFDPFFSQAKIQ